MEHNAKHKTKNYKVKEIDKLYTQHDIDEQLERDYQHKGVKYTVEESHYMREHPEDVIVSWRGPEHTHHPKGKHWYLIAALVLAGLIIYAIITSNILFAFIIILAGFVGFLMIERGPRVRDYAITYDGIVVGDQIYDFDDMDSFWIFYEPPHTRLISLHMKGKMVPYIHIPLHQLDPVDVREALLQFVPEKKQQPDFLYSMEQFFRI